MALMFSLNLGFPAHFFSITGSVSFFSIHFVYSCIKKYKLCFYGYYLLFIITRVLILRTSIVGFGFKEWVNSLRGYVNYCFRVGISSCDSDVLPLCGVLRM